jgi:hypothetical protein
MVTKARLPGAERHWLGVLGTCRFFGQSGEALVLNILQDEELDERARVRIRELLDRSDKELKP